MSGAENAGMKSRSRIFRERSKVAICFWLVNVPNAIATWRECRNELIDQVLLTSSHLRAAVISFASDRPLLWHLHFRAAQCLISWIAGMLRHALTPGEQAFAAYPRLAVVFHDPERFPCHSYLHHILIANP